MGGDPASRKADRDASGAGPLAIIAGSGDLPRAIAEEVSRSGRDLLVVEVEGECDSDLSAFGSVRLPIGAAGRLKALLVERGCRDVLMAGSFRRPRFSDIEWDMGTVKALSGIMRLKRGGDDRVVNGVVRIFESEGFRIVGPREVVPQFVAAPGALGRIRPDRKARAEIGFGLGAIARMGPLDIGQAVVVLSGRIVAVEAAEGTDAMVMRCAALRESGRIATTAPSGVLVKAAKPKQELRLDMPVVGVETVRAARVAGLEGIAVVAGEVLIPRIEDVCRVADEADLYVVGVERRDADERP